MYFDNYMAPCSNSVHALVTWKSTLETANHLQATRCNSLSGNKPGKTCPKTGVGSHHPIWLHPCAQTHNGWANERAPSRSGACRCTPPGLDSGAFWPYKDAWCSQTPLAGLQLPASCSCVCFTSDYPLPTWLTLGYLLFLSCL